MRDSKFGIFWNFASPTIQVFTYWIVFGVAWNRKPIEVNGIVDKSQLIATGNIVVRQGVFGKGEGYIKAGKSLWAKFINDTKNIH